MSSKKGGFYSYIQDNGHHDAWKIIVLVFLAAGIVAIAWIFSADRADVPNKVPIPVRQPSTVGEEKLRSIISTPSSLPPMHPTMTEAELRALLGKTAKPSTQK